MWAENDVGPYTNIYYYIGSSAHHCECTILSWEIIEHMWRRKEYVQLRYILPTLNQCIILWFILSKYDKNIFYSSLHIPQWLTTVFLLGNYIQQKIKTIKWNKSLNAFSCYVKWILIFLMYNDKILQKKILSRLVFMIKRIIIHSYSNVQFIRGAFKF